MSDPLSAASAPVGQAAGAVAALLVLLLGVDPAIAEAVSAGLKMLGAALAGSVLGLQFAPPMGRWRAMVTFVASSVAALTIGSVAADAGGLGFSWACVVAIASGTFLHLLVSWVHSRFFAVVDKWATQAGLMSGDK